jgi:hypothetical protein
MKINTQYYPNRLNYYYNESFSFDYPVNWIIEKTIFQENPFYQAYCQNPIDYSTKVFAILISHVEFEPEIMILTND